LSLSSAWLAPLNRGSLNSAHIHGTDVPVEEPSTASTCNIDVRPTGRLWRKADTGQKQAELQCRRESRSHILISQSVNSDFPIGESASA
jgi:hypothetical protein